MRASGLLLLFLLPVCYTLACDPLQISFYLCNSDVYCRTSMYIDENGADLPTFEFLYTRLFGNTSIQLAFEEMLCNETTNNTAAPSNFEKLWIITMSKYRYCNHINQYFDSLVNKCVCKADKLCKYTSANDEEFHFTDNSIFFIALLLTILAIVMFFVKRERTLYNMLSDLIDLLQADHEQQSSFDITFKE